MRGIPRPESSQSRLGDRLLTLWTPLTSRVITQYRHSKHGIAAQFARRPIFTSTLPKYLLLLESEKHNCCLRFDPTSLSAYRASLAMSKHTRSLIRPEGPKRPEQPAKPASPFRYPDMFQTGVRDLADSLALVTRYVYGSLKSVSGRVVSSSSRVFDTWGPFYSRLSAPNRSPASGG